MRQITQYDAMAARQHRRQSARIRFGQRDFERLQAHLQGDPSREQFAFALFRPVSTPDGLVMLVNGLFLPGPQDLETKTATCVSPTASFQAMTYAAAEAGGFSIADFHTHVTDGDVAFSSVDTRVAERNGLYIRDRFAPPATHAMVVFNRAVRCFAGRYFNRATGRDQPIEAIDVVGRPLMTLSRSGLRAASDLDEVHARQALVPGWNHGMLAAQRVGIVGAGGNGAALVQMLASMGVGADGWIAIADPDGIEASNLPRIPYAVPGDVGQPKVTVAAEFIRRKNPRIAVFPFPCPAADPAVEARFSAATILVGAGDNDGVRKLCNDWSVRYGVPYIDLGCDVQITNKSVHAGGQVRVVVPGQTGCLACVGGFDSATAALDLSDELTMQRRAAAGYVIGAAAPTTPSIASLNAITAQMAVMAILSLLASGPFEPWDYAHFDFLTGRTITAMTLPSAACPVCGPDGVLLNGTHVAVRPFDSEPSWLSLTPSLHQEES